MHKVGGEDWMVIGWNWSGWGCGSNIDNNKKGYTMCLPKLTFHDKTTASKS